MSVKMKRTKTALLVQKSLIHLLFLPQILPTCSRTTRTAMLVKPMHSVRGLILSRLPRMSRMIWAVPLPASRPTSESTCPRRITSATAEIQPVRTEADTKSRRNPSFRRPTARE